MIVSKFDSLIKDLIEDVNATISLDEKIEKLNAVKKALHNISPFKDEPVDCVIWIKNNTVKSNDYNPNVVAPPEMELLKISILEDGYTQPIVTFKNAVENMFEVVDGFHRNRVGKECAEVKNRINNYLPIVEINEWKKDKADRIASTVRHNRARGKHTVDGMAELVIDLKKRNWSDQKISKHLGMDVDEILRLSQITGLAEMFSNKEFSQAWEASD